MTKIISTNPSTKELLGEVDVSTYDEVHASVEKARNAQKEWRELGLTKRVELLRNVLQNFEKEKDNLALLISQEMGMPISESKHEVDSGLEYFAWYLDNAEKYLADEITFENDAELHKVIYEPLGTFAIIVPWNFPFSNFVWQACQNLIVGNTVVFKHSEECVLFGKEIEKIFSQSSLPDGVFAEVYGSGDVGNALVHENIDMIGFTGSTEVGKYLYNVAAEKMIPVRMELGGSAPGVVFDDADVDDVLETIYINKFLNCGQVCDGLKRLIVHENRFDEVVSKLKAMLQDKKIGNAENKDTEIGPLVSEKQFNLFAEQIKSAVDEGAKVIFGGKPSDDQSGFFYEPTLLTNVLQEMRVWKEEIFGPALPIVKFATYDEAISLANDTDYGLGAYVFTKDKELFEKTSKDIKTGMVAMNNASYLQPCNPFGGCKMSGFGREHGKYGFHELCNVKIVANEK